MPHSPKHHDKYYFNSGDVTFDVGDSRFKIHLYLLIGSESSSFRSFRTPDGSSVDRVHPLPLAISLRQFEALMRILYPPHPLEDPWSISTETLIGAMQASVKFGMHDVQNAVAEVVKQAGKPKDLDVAFGRLLLCAEFPTHFSDNHISHLFVYICRYEHHPTDKQHGLFRGKLDGVNTLIKEGRGKFAKQNGVGANVGSWWQDNSKSLDETQAKVVKLIRQSA